jgi:hypothetical protein
MMSTLKASLFLFLKCKTLTQKPSFHCVAQILGDPKMVHSIKNPKKAKRKNKVPNLFVDC